jgi:hypothetical protein
MTVTTLPDLIQGTDEWLDQRRGMVTASMVGRLITPKTVKPAENPESRSLVAQLVAERITGFTDSTYVSDDMWRGTLDEPVARDLYSEHFTPVTEVGFMVRDDWGFSIGYSPDGLVGDDGLIECKSRRPKTHLAHILADQIPPENMAQLQAGLLVSGRDWCDYVSYCAGMPLWVKRVTPDERWQTAIVDTVRKFEDTAALMLADYQRAVEGLPMTERQLDRAGIY